MTAPEASAEPVVLSARAVDRLPSPTAAGVTWLIRTPTRLDRALWRRDVTAAGASFVSELDLIAAMERAIEAAAPANGDEWAAVLARYRDMLEHPAAPPDDAAARAAEQALLRDVDTIEMVLCRADPRVAVAKSNWRFWNDVAPDFACRRFLIGAEGAAFAARPGPDGLLPEDALADIPDGDIAAIGWRAIALLMPGRAQRKN